MLLIKKLLSYLIPISIEKRKGTLNAYLEVQQYKGKLLLNAEHVNYSYGGMHKLFDALFQKTRISQYDFQSVLILGMGAGSNIKLLKDKYQYKGSITAVEKDEVVIELAHKHFDMDQYPALEIIHADAFDFVSTSENKYDLIISDLFVEANVPAVFASPEYLSNLKRISNSQSCLIYNKMTEDPLHKKEVAKLLKDLQLFFPGTKIHKLYSAGSENSLVFYNTLLKKHRENSNRSASANKNEKLLNQS